MPYLYRVYPNEAPLDGQELVEFKQLLKDRPELRKAYKDFKDRGYQELRSRLGRSPWLDSSLDKIFELAAAGTPGLEGVSDKLGLDTKERRSLYKDFGRDFDV